MNNINEEIGKQKELLALAEREVALRRLLIKQLQQQKRIKGE